MTDLTPALRASLERGLAQSAAGQTVDLGDFTQYAEGEIVERPIGVLDRLRNGFTVIAIGRAPFYDNESDRAVCVLATNGYEYASWITGESDREGTTWGRYSPDLARAVQVWQERCK